MRRFNARPWVAVSGDSLNSRAGAVRVLQSVLEQGRSLNEALPEDAEPLLSELVFGVTRWYWRLVATARTFLAKPIRRKDRDVELLILVGLYQLQQMRIPVHAAINETVKASRQLGKSWAKGLINGVLRTYVRQGGADERSLPEEARYSHPQWLIDHIRGAWPEFWQTILRANNERPPMVLRVNRLRTTRDGYLKALARVGVRAHPDRHCRDAVILDTPAPVDNLPGFRQGLVSVQDAAAQCAAPMLPVDVGARVLDACSAPGGKLTHILERCPQAGRVLAIDISGGRAALIGENLRRLGLSAEVRVADAADASNWWDGRPFDSVLLDVPCTGTGVIRRHPDIKHLRRPGDLRDLVVQQQRLLARVWETVAPGGHLLYVTCSVFPEENEQQIARFVEAREDAEARPAQAPVGLRVRYGLQTLPGVHNVDGFFFALLQKAAST